MNHRIRRQILELELPRAEGAATFQRQAGRVFQEKVLPKLDALFSKIAPAGRIVRIERLEIDLGSFGEGNWEERFVESCVEQIGRQVEEAAFNTGSGAGGQVQNLRPGENALAIFRYFLETGTLPWYARGMGLAELEAVLLPLLREQPTVLQQSLWTVLRQNQTALLRLVWQFGPGLAQSVVEIVLALAPGRVAQLLQTRQSPGRTLDARTRAAFLQALINAEPTATSAPARPAPDSGQLLSPASSTAADPVEPARRSRPEAGPELPDRPVPTTNGEAEPVRQQPRTMEFPAEGLAVENAGAVLLAVYLPAFFKALNLLTDNDFASEEHRCRAIHLLHYLSTGQENPEEPVLILAKLLCGQPIETPVPLTLELSAAEKGESAQLLEAVIRNWPALKNTSPDGLRSGFLQRPGQLYALEDGSGWLLRPERQAQDLLLERLPWSISVLKLPWMAAAIRVEW